MNPVIVDLLPELQVVVHPPGIPVIGKFEQETSLLSLSLTEVRAHSIVQEICNQEIDKPDPLTLFVPDCWQSFAIIGAVSWYFQVTPRIVMMDAQGVMTDLFDFHSGQMFLRHRIRKVVMPNNMLSKKGVVIYTPNSTVPNSDESK